MKFVTWVMIFIVLAVMIAGQCGAANFILGDPTNKIFNSDGSAGTLTSPNNYSTISVFRKNVASQVAKIQKGKYFEPAKNLPVRWVDDMNSVWPTSPSAGDEIIQVAEVKNGVNGYTGPDYFGACRQILVRRDITRGYAQLPPVFLQLFPVPAVQRISNTAIKVSWKAMNDSKCPVEKYVLLRSSDEGTFETIADIKHKKGSLSYVDKTAGSGQKYAYKIRLKYTWPANDPAYYISAAESPISGEK
jgi:hypothetical protein